MSVVVDTAGDGRNGELVINVNTPILPPSDFDVQHLESTSYRFTWSAPQEVNYHHAVHNDTLKHTPVVFQKN